MLIYLRYFVIIFPWKIVGPSFKQTWIYFTTGCFVQNLVEISTVVIFFKKNLSNFTIFVIIYPWKSVWPFIWTNLNPINQMMISAKFGWFSRRIFFKILLMYFCYFVIISPWKGLGPSFEQTWIPFTKWCFVLSLVEIGQVVLKKKIFRFHQCIFATS